MEKTLPMKSSRLNARISPEQKKVLEKAASLQGQALTDFVVNAAHQEAQRIVREAELLRLTQEDAEHIYQLLTTPSEPNAALKAAFARHKDQL